MRRNLPSKPPHSLAGALVLRRFITSRYRSRNLALVSNVSLRRQQGNRSVCISTIPGSPGVAYTPSFGCSLLRDVFGERILGLKDSSGDVAYARQIAALFTTFDVFPSNEANLLLARATGLFAGSLGHRPISTQRCARAYKDGDATALARAVAIRSICDGLPLVPAVKSMVALLGR